VFYELAVAQCAARPTLLLIEKGQDLPFDVKDLRTIEYEMQPIGRLVDGYYADIMAEQVGQLAERNWRVPGLFEQFDFAPKFETEQQVRRLLEEVRPQPLPAGVDKHFALPSDPERRLTIVTGDIIDLATSGTLANLGADVIVSLENTYLQLDSFFSLSMSGKLRHLDSEKSPGGRLLDSLGQALDEQIRERNIVLPVVPGTVVPTPTRRLADRGVKAVFHVAGLRGTVGDGYELPDGAIDDCVRGVFDTFAEHADTLELKTILLPMLGSFMTHLDQEDVVHQVVHAVLLKMQYVTSCREVMLLAWIESQRTALYNLAAELGWKKVDT
jgi:O-acetyl-ADP-ribose deacetylase (regulator of RNase III)